MMHRDIHLTPDELLDTLQFKHGDFGDIGIISGQTQRAKMCLRHLDNPVKNFSFLGYTFWTGEFKGKRVTVGNGGFYAPDSAFTTELLCTGGLNTIIRMGSCGSMDENIAVGDYIVADSIIRGEGTTPYYVDETFKPSVDRQLSQQLYDAFDTIGNVHFGCIWTTDALFRETKEVVNKYIEKGAIAVDMVTSPLVTIANLYNKRVASIFAVSDNLITGDIGFTDIKFIEAEMAMVKEVFTIINQL